MLSDSMTMLKVGDKVPNFQFTATNGTSSTLYDIPGKKIVFFYPKAFTGGCTKEACSMRDNYETFQDLGYEVFGVSVDNLSVQEEFATKFALSYYVIPDSDRTITDIFGVKLGFSVLSVAKRVTFILDENNMISHVSNLGIRGGNSALGLENHADEILELIGAEPSNT